MYSIPSTLSREQHELAACMLWHLTGEEKDFVQKMHEMAMQAVPIPRVSKQSRLLTELITGRHGTTDGESAT